MVMLALDETAVKRQGTYFYLVAGRRCSQYERVVCAHATATGVRGNGCFKTHISIDRLPTYIHYKQRKSSTAVAGKGGQVVGCACVVGSILVSQKLPHEPP